VEYKLWDIESGHYIGKYTDEEAALAAVKSLITQYGDHYAESLSLGRVNSDGSILAPLTGDVLRARAFEPGKLAGTVRHP
jgi:hypothetical protein